MYHFRTIVIDAETQGDGPDRWRQRSAAADPSTAGAAEDAAVWHAHRQKYGDGQTSETEKEYLDRFGARGFTLFDGLLLVAALAALAWDVFVRWAA